MHYHIERYSLFGTEYSAVSYKTATEAIIHYAQKHQSFGVSALAVHGLVTSIIDPNLKRIINNIKMIVPDGQPVRWALNSFFNIGLQDRVYGPDLTLHVLDAADKNRLNVFLYGSTKNTLTAFRQFISTRYPNVNICGIHVDRFRDATDEEDMQDIEGINNSDAHIVLVGRGCPRQEMWVANHIGKINAVMMAVGAAFDFHAGTVAQAPAWMQNNGLEWLYRLLKEPKRLWKRYFFTNSIFIFLFLKHKFILRRPTI